MIALTIAGSDSGGGAGIQADLKTFAALGVYGASVITALTAQNTIGVQGVFPIPADFVADQLTSVMSDLDVAAIKIGMLADVALIDRLADMLAAVPVPVVLDPVMVSASGHRLVPQEAVAALRERLFGVATIVTPNVPEAAVLLGTAEATGEAQMREQALALADRGPAILLKGGHLEGGESVDILCVNGVCQRLTSPRVATRNTHGTGCTLSSAIAAHLAKGAGLADAVAGAKRYISGAIAAADRLSIGHGHGPVHHFHALWQDAQ
ncbi:bifunctional hydroxymethylpyrimidine kinase/phosphomethylpyrimidine kinase [Acuticoccus sp. I52.16.1]|uniref:bifunctional hydroxymethylpyrimidine kinase/phosphomethylpyrimidine kinase n=1 Tax=Acuticoccus sp. I52.16.1 TaxID=2928472 RepID=UPI001FD1C6AC|nr:bifunctional hydroxymethylpyrimidine kinase/phosphomethylpyrimidine kinase [Acuticoccus sp. I52.16.1]UOM34639.1 bifunctional hydroxymethylpyrimidine kinase/phosphomethylpyrimidine kinase [Acuticoccus sp. I52.16.1]